MTHFAVFSLALPDWLFLDLLEGLGFLFIIAAFTLALAIWASCRAERKRRADFILERYRSKK